MKPRARASVRPAADDVTASELAAFKYCAKAWHLEHVSGVHPSPTAALRRDAGTRDHQRHGAEIHAGSWLARHRWAAAITLLVTALALFLVAIRV